MTTSRSDGADDYEEADPGRVERHGGSDWWYWPFVVVMVVLLAIMVVGWANQ